jgi:RNA polymerase sigma factor (sigma-70 family)
VPGTVYVVLKLLPDVIDPEPRDACPAARGGDPLWALVQQARHGRREATQSLLVALGASMLRMIRKVLGPTDPDAEDVLQEALFAVVKALPSFRGECSAKTFGCRIAALTALKARRRHRTARMAETSPDEPCWEGIDERDWALASCRRQMLRRLLDELADPQAEALLLHCIDGMTVEEIATASHSPPETVRSRLRLAKAALRERVAQDPSLFELLEDTL